MLDATKTDPLPALAPTSLVWSEEILAKVSRSFAVVIMRLPLRLRLGIGAFYIVLRALDTVEDDMTFFEGEHTGTEAGQGQGQGTAGWGDGRPKERALRRFWRLLAGDESTRGSGQVLGIARGNMVSEAAAAAGVPHPEPSREHRTLFDVRASGLEGVGEAAERQLMHGFGRVVEMVCGSGNKHVSSSAAEV